MKISSVTANHTSGPHSLKFRRIGKGFYRSTTLKGAIVTQNPFGDFDVASWLLPPEVAFLSGIMSCGFIYS